MVALHPEGVDRNSIYEVLPAILEVALHPEGVDRNWDKSAGELPRLVALHPEGVDRNADDRRALREDTASPSTRRAWIEMDYGIILYKEVNVALHPEGVDRNCSSSVTLPGSSFRSPSTRRAWIEIVPLLPYLFIF